VQPGTCAKALLQSNNRLIEVSITNFSMLKLKEFRKRKFQ
jgi:hypothetical protein